LLFLPLIFDLLIFVLPYIFITLKINTPFMMNSQFTFNND
jgi:hypothetical protein